MIDRNAIGDESAASFGNAGVLAACSVAPVTAPGLALKGPGLLMDPNFPLFLRWSYLPKLAPWLFRYLSHANDADTRRIAKGLTPLTHDSVDQHLSLVHETPAQDWVTTSDYAFAYSDRAAFDADAYTWELRREAGFVPELIEGAAAQDYEPTLSSDFECLAVMKDHGFLHKPAQYLKALEKVALSLGVGIRQEAVIDLELSDGRVSGVVTDKGRHACTNAVLSTGVWSKPWIKKLGINVPLESERGYHIELAHPNCAPRVPLMITTGKFVATPMENALRCAGVVEFGGAEAPASEAPLALLRKKVCAAFPDLEMVRETSWLGHRPAPTDSLPLIGEIKNTGVFAGFGHHHIGMTAGPKTGRIIAGLITGKPQNVDLAPYRPERFAAG